MTKIKHVKENKLNDFLKDFKKNYNIWLERQENDDFIFDEETQLAIIEDLNNNKDFSRHLLCFKSIMNPTKKVLEKTLIYNIISLKKLKDFGYNIDNFSEDIYLKCIQNDIYNLDIIKNPTEKMYIEALKSDYQAINFIPIEKLNHKIINVFLEENNNKNYDSMERNSLENCIKDIKDEFLERKNGKEKFLDLFDKINGNSRFDCIFNDLCDITDRYFNKTKNKNNNERNIYILKEDKLKDFKESFDYNQEDWKENQLKNNFVFDEKTQLYLVQNGDNIDFAYIVDPTEKICIEALKKCYALIRFISKENQTSDIVKSFFENNNYDFNGLQFNKSRYVEFLNEKFITKDDIINMIKDDTNSINFLPYELKDKIIKYMSENNNKIINYRDYFDEFL